MVSESVFAEDGFKLDWKAIWEDIPANANEPLVCRLFVERLLEELGFSQQEWFPEFSTGKGACKVDYAARKNNGKDHFIKVKTNPYILIEAKGRQTIGGAKINLATGTPQYKETQAQIKDYLLSSKCTTAQWGIITNADYIQLFRRHGKVVFPATPNYLIKILLTLKKLGVMHLESQGINPRVKVGDAYPTT